MNTRVLSLLHSAALFASLTAATACGRPSPVSPTPSSPSIQAGDHASSGSPAMSAGERQAISADAVIFPLLAGSFAIVNRDGDGIVGTYTGAAQFAQGGLPTSSLLLEVSSGSGSLAGAAGTLEVKGAGAFAGSGDFSLDGGGSVTLAGGKRAVVVLSLRGSSVISCSTGGQIAIDQTADGVLPRAGRVAARLSHVVGNTRCGS
jgi:hypothetical protein